MRKGVGRPEWDCVLQVYTTYDTEGRKKNLSRLEKKTIHKGGVMVKKGEVSIISEGEEEILNERLSFKVGRNCLSQGTYLPW